VTATDVARWMVERVTRDGLLEQAVAVAEIEEIFGAAFVYTNDRGNQALDRSVLTAFRKLTADTVVWERSERAWRRRESFDTPGKRQAE